MDDLLYLKAFQYFGTNLWKTLWDSQIFAVKFSDRNVGYCCVMGASGEHLALGVYMGEEGIRSYLRLAYNFEGYSDIDDIERMTSQECIMCSFVRQSQLERKEQLRARAIIKKLGLSLEQTKLFPVFEKFIQYHLPTTNIPQKEYQYVIEAFDACFEVSEKLKIKSPEEINLTADAELCGKTIPYLTLRKDGKYTWRTKKLPKDVMYPLYAASNYNEILAKKIKKLKNNNQTWYCATFRLNKAVNDESKIPMFPLVQVLVEKQSEMILNIRICDSNNPYCTTLPNQLFDTILEIGKPHEIITCDLKAQILYENLLKELEIESTYNPNTKTINRIKLQLRNWG